jgi:very-short-patch-repair endonuclease
MIVRHSLEENERNNVEKSKAIRLIEYLTRLASLRSKVISNLSEYKNVLWLKDIPRQKGCFTQAWGYNEDFDSEVWIEVQNLPEPPLPSVPSSCRDWVERSSLQSKSSPPCLLLEITQQLGNPAWHEGSDQPEFISYTECLESHPEIQQAWEQYVEGHWLPWVEAHNEWESVHKIYSRLFAIYQEQIRLGEEYELILGLGLLTWKTPNGQHIRRHLIIANALLEFESRLGKFTVRPMAEGAQVRPELDMLEEQPARAEEIAKSSLARAEGDPWEKGCIEGVLLSLVHSLDAQGEYDGTIEAKNIQESAKPIVEYAPALILRKRSAKGLTQTLRQMKENIEQDGGIPSQFEDLAEIRSGSNSDSENDLREANNSFDGEVFFPKPSNEAQRCIVDKMRRASGVLVQGPPGTGKSHTIANLICHLLATGKRILVTAQTTRALQVLEGLLPDELRPLCISLLGSGLEEKQSLESSINGILRKSEECNEQLAGNEREENEQKLRRLREEKARIDRRLRDIRESEAHSQSIAEGTYRGTAARIAEAVNRDRNTYEWFTDTASLEKSCPVSEGKLQSVLTALRQFTPEKRQELNLAWIRLDAMPLPEQLANLIENEKKAVEEENASAIETDENIASQLSNIDVAAIDEVRETLSAFHSTRRQLLVLTHPWMHGALRDIIGGNSSLWRQLSHVTRETIDSIEELVPVADDTQLDFPDGTHVRTLFEDACDLVAHLEKGGTFGWGPFRPKLVKERIYVLKTIRVNGRLCSDLDHLLLLADALWVHIKCEKVWEFWVGRHEPTQGPYALQLQSLKSLRDALDGALSLEGFMGKCREALQQCPALGEPIWTDESQLEQWIATCRLAKASYAKHLAIAVIHSIESPLLPLAGGINAHPVMGELLQALRNRDLDGYVQAANKIRDLEEERQHIQKMDEDLEEMRRHVPRLMEQLEHTYPDPRWDMRVQEIVGAWRWSQARFWVEEYISADDVPSLSSRVHQIEDEINGIIAKLASLHAWSFCFSRLQEKHHRHMQAWQQSMRRLGKGTGKHASRHRREARQHLNECREAVPAWVMPLHRIWDTVAPAPGIFDVIIVDEASQCGVGALPLLYLGKKIVIVGDDKQISPEAVGLPREAVESLMEEFLHDYSLKSSFDIDSSLFDHGKLRYGTQRVTLREHFRCMPEIIRFSNDLCYSDTPLIPLRQYGPDRLTPLEHIFVDGGYREGSGNRVINRPEADKIVEKIAELCSDERYAGKTMGVVVLQSGAQADLIERELLEKLGAEEIKRRRLVCGNPYSFQGDERDIMLLSMIAASNERIGPFTKAADERRFNVAASRARDQMFLFHSVTHNDLSAFDLRRRLLEFFENTRPQEIAGINREELERRAAQDNRSIIKPIAPFDSWFEVDVALELLRKGFSIIPQYEVAGKRIDLVVEGGRSRLAVECDGDNWHGADRYEADMERQRILERCGWEFFRIRESAFYSNKENALKGLWQVLEEGGIRLGAWEGNQEPELSVDCDDYNYDEESGERLGVVPLSTGRWA